MTETEVVAQWRELDHCPLCQSSDDPIWLMSTVVGGQGDDVPKRFCKQCSLVYGLGGRKWMPVLTTEPSRG